MKKRILPLLLTLVMVLSLLPAPALAAETTSDPLEGSAIGTAEPEPTSPTEPEPTSPTEPEPTSPTEPEPTSPTEPEPTSPTEPEPTSPTEPEPTSPAEPEPTSPAAPLAAGVLNTDGSVPLTADVTTFVAGTTYTISDAEQLQRLARIVNSASSPTDIKAGRGCTFILTQNIDMSEIASWKPIGHTSFTGGFCGTFDGQGYTISNLTINATSQSGNGISYCWGLFGVLNQGTIQDVQLHTVSASVTGTAGKGYLGSLLGYSSNGVIKDIRVLDGTLTYTQNAANEVHVGGLVGYSSAANISGCNIDITASVDGSGGGKASLGGLVGYNVGDGRGTITDSTVNVVSLTHTQLTNKDVYVGGLAGYSAGSRISGCTVNVANSVTAADTGGSASEKMVCAGGLAGWLSAGRASQSVQKNTINITGSVAAKSPTATYTCAGGISGRLEGSSTYVDGCTVNITGSVSATGNHRSGSNTVAGGITGWTQFNPTIQNCTVSGTGAVQTAVYENEQITSTDAQTPVHAAGGVAGYTNIPHSGTDWPKSPILNCHVDLGTVEAAGNNTGSNLVFFAGGAVGYSKAPQRAVRVENCCVSVDQINAVVAAGSILGGYYQWLNAGPDSDYSPAIARCYTDSDKPLVAAKGNSTSSGGIPRNSTTGCAAFDDAGALTLRGEGTLILPEQADLITSLHYGAVELGLLDWSGSGAFPTLTGEAAVPREATFPGMPSSLTWTLGGENVIDSHATVTDGSTVSYRWRKKTAENRWLDVPNATGSALTVWELGTFSCLVSSTIGDKVSSSTSPDCVVTGQDGEPEPLPVLTAPATNGTYYICTADQLKNISKHPFFDYGEGSTLLLANDIDLTGVDWSDARPSLKGVFNGQGHTVSNLSIQQTGTGTSASTTLYCGLFDSLRNNAEVRNLNLASPSITLTQSASYGCFAGALAGWVNTGSNSRNVTVNNVQVTNPTIQVTGGGEGSNDIANVFAGGLIGRVDFAAFTNCSVTGGSLSATTTNVNTPLAATGGLVGSIYNISANNKITNCYAQGVDLATTLAPETTGQAYHGGLVGYGFVPAVNSPSHYASLTNCYTAAVTGDGKGMVGGYSGGWPVSASRCYSDAADLGVTGEYCLTFDGSGSLSGGPDGTVTLLAALRSGVSSGLRDWEGTGTELTFAASSSTQEISITGATVASKTYDGNQNASVTGVTFSNGAALVKDTDYTATASFADANAAADKTVTVTVALTGEAAEVYTLSRNTATFRADINPAAYTYTHSGATGVIVGSPISAVSGVKTASGVNNETVSGELAWFTDLACSSPATDAAFASIGTVDLYWKFTPAASETNYAAEPQQADTALQFTVSGKDAAMLVVTQADSTFGGSLADPAYTKPQGAGDVTVTYTGTGQTAYGPTAHKPTQAGTYSVALYCESSSHIYEGAATFTIAKKALSLSGATAEGRPYQAGNTNVTITAVSFNESAPLPTLGSGFTASGKIAYEDAGRNKTVTVRVTLIDPNYSLAVKTTSTTVDISKLPAGSIANQSVSYIEGESGKRTFDFAPLIPAGHSVSAVSYGYPTNLDVLTFLASPTNLTTVEYKLTGTAAAGASCTIPITYTFYNHTSVQVELTVNIVAGAPQTVTFAQAGPVAKTYGDAPFTNGASASGGGAVSYSSSDASVASVDGASGQVSIHKAGSAVITATAAAVPGQYAPGTASYTLNIGKKAPDTKDFKLVHSNGTQFQGGTSQTYGTNGISYHAEVAEGVTGMGEPQLRWRKKGVDYPTLANMATTTFDRIASTTPAAQYQIFVYVPAGDNYQEALVVTGGIQIIDTRQLVIKDGDLAVTKTYDGTAAAPALTALTGALTLSGSASWLDIINNDQVAAEVVSVTDYPNAEAGQHTVTLRVKLTGADMGNYSFYVSGSQQQVQKDYDFTAAITPAEYGYSYTNMADVTVGSPISAVSGTKTATGVNDETLSGELAWFTNQDCSNAATDAAFATAGTANLYWKFTPAAGETNYVATPKTGATSFTVAVGAEQDFTFDETTVTNQVYGDSFTRTAIGLPNGGDIRYTSGDTDVATVNAATGEVRVTGIGTTTITATAAAVPGSYRETTKSYQITTAARPLTISGVIAQNRTYDGSKQVTLSGGALQNVVAGDTEAEIGFTLGVGTLADKNKGDNKPVATAITLAGTKIAYYTLTQPTEVKVNISAKDVTISGVNAADKTFDGTTAAVVSGTAVIVGKIEGDHLNVAPGSAAFERANAGSSISVRFSGFYLVGANVTNYNLTAQPAAVTASILKAAAQTPAPLQFWHKVGTTGLQTGSVASLMPDNAGTLTFTAGTKLDGNGIISAWSVDERGIVSYTLNGNGAAGNSATLPVTIGSGNYSDAVAEVVVVLTAKETQAAPAAFELIFTLDAGGVTYTASIPTVEGAEYSFDGNTWGATNTRGNVAPNETVTGYMRMAETEDRAASPATLATAPAPLLKVKTPTAAPNGGAFTSVQEITLRCATDGAVIHYTTDGSTPTTASNRYVDSFTVSVTTTVKAIAVKTGMVDSEVLSVTYTKYSGGNSSYTRPKTEMEKLVERIEKAKEGETVKYELSGNTLVVKEVFGALAGRSITLELTTGTVTWIIKGADIQKSTQLKDLDLGVKVGANVIAMDVINAVTGDKTATQLDLKHSGSFGLEMTMRVTLGTENVGQFANLYYFNKAAGELEYRSAAPIDADGKAALIFSSGAQYLIVIDEINHAPWSNPFADVRESDWFYSAVAYVHTNGLMAGTASAAFSPSKTTTRGMIVTILYRMAGAPAISGEGTAFTDVSSDKYYSQAVAWAWANGIVGGYGNGRFGPDDPITREQLAVILMNYAKLKGVDTTAQADLAIFSDADQISGFAVEALAWANHQGLINGKGDSILNPKGKATRAETAAILMRFRQN